MSASRAHTDQTFGAYGENPIIGTRSSLGGPRTGVVGHAPDALGLIGVSASAGDAATALGVSGRARFSRSGRASVPAGRSFVDVTVPGGIGSSSLVVATPMVNRPGVHVQSAVPDQATGKVRIYLNKVVSTATSALIAWFVIN